MGEKKCIGCKVYHSSDNSCSLGYKIKVIQYSATRSEAVALDRCPRPTNFRHAKQLLAEKG